MWPDRVSNSGPLTNKSDALLIALRSPALYQYTVRTIALPPVLALALAAAVTWTKCLSFTLKFQCDGQGAMRRPILYADRSCCT